MNEKPTYKELERRVEALEKKSVESKRVVESLRESEQRYRLLVESFHDLPYMVNSDGIVTFVGPQIQRFKYTPEEVISRHYLDFVVPEQRQQVKQSFEQGTKNGTSFPTEFQWQGKDGRLYWAEAVGQIVSDDSGHPVMQIGVLRDISERKQALKKLEESHQMLQTISDTIEGEVFVKDRQGKYLFVNRAFGKDFDVNPQDVIGKDDYFIFPPEVAAKLQENDQRIMAGGKAETIEESGVFKGNHLTYVTNKVPLIDGAGNVIGICGVGFDITRQKEMEQALFEAQLKYRDLYESAPDMFVSVDAKTAKILNCNQTFADKLGYSKEEIIGRPVFDIYTPNSAERAKVNVFPLFLKNGKIVDEEMQLQGKDGSHIDASLNESAVRDEQGSILSSRSVFRDITKRKELEDALRKSKNDLERKVRERTARLSDTLDKLRESQYRYRTVADFTYAWEYWSNLDGTLQYVSPSCERISGYSPQQFIENPPLLREIVVSEDQNIWQEHYRDSRKEQKPREIEFRIRRKDGEIRWVEHTCQPVISDQGELLGFRASNRDISKRKQAEIKLQKAYAEIKVLKDQLEADRTYLREEIKLSHDYEHIIGNSDTLRYVLFRAEQIAPTDTTVLILGETGTGKELIARAIHNASTRKNRPLIKVDCAALPSNLIESELFGHEKGAFTGAVEKRAGRFELASGGTLFLDEIGELPIALQSKLLRVLQDGEFERLGSSKTLHTDVRIISATNRNLEEDMRNNKFRIDLWYRLNIFTISIPPLRERREDIGLLVNYMIKRFERKLGKKIRSIPSDMIAKLQRHTWPGNIRELENVIQRAVINTQGDTLQFEEVLGARGAEDAVYLDRSIKSLDAVEREHILLALRKTNWKIHGKDGAAMLLDINPSTLRGRMRKHRIERPPYNI